MYTLGDQRGTLGCWGDDLDAVEVHLMKRLEVKVLARMFGKRSGEAGFLKRVLRHDAATESFFWCCRKRYVLGAAATLQLTGRSHECKTAGDSWEMEARSSMGTRHPPSGALWHLVVRGSGQAGDPVRHQDRGIVRAISDEVGDGQAQANSALSAGVHQERCAEVPRCVRRQRLGRRQLVMCRTPRV